MRRGWSDDDGTFKIRGALFTLVMRTFTLVLETDNPLESVAFTFRMLSAMVPTGRAPGVGV